MDKVKEFIANGYVDYDDEVIGDYEEEEDDDDDNGYMSSSASAAAEVTSRDGM